MRLKERIPPTHMIVPVFAVIAFFVFAWTIVNFLWQLSSWLYFLTVGEIMIILSYSMTSALLDSLILLAILLGLCLLLPPQWMRDHFIARGTTAAVFGLGVIMLSVFRFTQAGFSFVASLPLYFWLGLGLTVAMTILSVRINIWTRAVSWLADQMIIFLFILMPLSLVSVIVVVIRNLF